MRQKSRSEPYLLLSRITGKEVHRIETKLRHYLRKTDHGLQKKKTKNKKKRTPGFTMNADSTKTQSTSSNNGNYRESLALHLPGYVILEDEVYVAQPEKIGEQGNTRLLECFNKNIDRNLEARHKKTYALSEKRFPWNIKGRTTKTETLNANNDHCCENTAEHLPRFVVRDDSVNLKKSIIFKQRKTPSVVSINQKKCPNPKLKHRKTHQRLPPKNSLGSHVKVVGSIKNANSSGNGQYLMNSAKTLSRYVIRYNKLYKTQTEIEPRYTKSLMSMTKQNALIPKLGDHKEGNEFSKENIQAQNTNVGGFKTQEFSTTNNSYVERPALHLPGHVILDNDDDDDDDSDIQSRNIFRPSKSHSVMCISQQNATVPKKIRVKTDSELSQKKNSRYGIKGGGPKSQASSVYNEPYFGIVAQNLPRYVILDNNVYFDETEVEPKRISSNKYTNEQNVKIPEYDSNKLDYRLFNQSIQASTENDTGKNSCSSKIAEKKIYAVSGVDIYFTQSEIILEPRQTPSMEYISQETNSISESITGKEDNGISSKTDAGVSTKSTQTKSKALSSNNGRYCENCSQLLTIYDVPEYDIYFRKSEMISESRKPRASASYNQLNNSVFDSTYSETDINLSEKDTQTQTQESSSNNGTYCVICGEHLPIYGVTDDDIYFTQSQILLELRKTLPIEDISTQNAEVRNEKTDKGLSEESCPDDGTKAGGSKMQESCLTKCNYLKTSAQDLPRYVFIDISNLTETKTKVKPKGTTFVEGNAELTSQVNVLRHGKADDEALQKCIQCHAIKVAKSKTQASNGNYCETSAQYLVRYEVPDHDVYFKKSEMVCEQRKTHDPENINQRNNFKLELIHRRTDEGVSNESFLRHNTIATQTETQTLSSNNINSSESCAKVLPIYKVPDHDVYFKESVVIFEFRKTRISVCENHENNLTPESECSLLKETCPCYTTEASQTEKQALSLNSVNYCETCANHLPKYEAPNRNVRFQNSEMIFEPRKTHESISKNQGNNSIPESMPDKIGDALLNESYPDHITEVSQTKSQALSSNDDKYCEKKLCRYEVPDHDVYFKKSAMIFEPRKTHASLWKPQRNKSIPELIREKTDDALLNESISCPITETNPRETKGLSTNGHYCENCGQPQPRSEVPDHDIYFRLSEMVLTPRDTYAFVRIKKQRNNSNLEFARRKTDESLPNESYPDLTTKACQTKTQTLSPDKNKYCENCAKHLSIYEVPDDDVYFTQPEILLKPRNIDSLSHESLPISTTHTKSQAPSPNKFDYSDCSPRHLPRYVILRDNRNDTSSKMIDEPEETSNTVCISQQNGSISELAHVSTVKDKSNESSSYITAQLGEKQPVAVSSNNDNYCKTCGLPLPIYGVSNDDIYFAQSEVIFQSRTTMEGTSKPTTSITGLTQGNVHDHLPEEKVPVHTMVAGKTEMNILSGNNGNYCKYSSQKLPIYGVPDVDVYFTQSKIIFEPRTTPSVWGITQRNNSIPLLIHGEAASGLPHENLPTSTTKNDGSKLQARSFKKSKRSDKSAKYPPRYVMVDDNVYRNTLKTIHNGFY